MYDANLAPSGNITLWRLAHISEQSMAGWSCMMRTSCGFVSSVDVVLKLPHTLRLKARPVSACLRGSVFPIRENKFVGIPRSEGSLVCAWGFVLGDSEAHTLRHSAVSYPLLYPWAQNVVRKRARHLAAISIKSVHPSFVRICMVDKHTLKITPRHVPGYCR